MISNHFYCTVCHIYFIVTKLHFSILYLKMCIVGIFTEARLLFDSLSTSWYSTFAKLFWKINKKKNKINYNKVFLKYDTYCKNICLYFLQSIYVLSFSWYYKSFFPFNPQNYSCKMSRNYKDRKSFWYIKLLI